MKIGILTFHNTNNFGGALQTYALLTAIQKLGVDCEIIDYRSETITNRYRVQKLTEVKGLKGIIKYFLNNRANIKTKKSFDEFYKKYLYMSYKSFDKESIRSSNDLYDKFIVGSDQVWNLSLSGMDYTYFLDFVDENNKKNAYAASFGVSMLDSNINEKVCSLLNEFNNISVREPKPQNLVNINNEKSINVNLDPTFLISKQEWESLCNYDIKNKEYILLYTVSSNPFIFEFAKKLSKRNNNCEIIYLHHTHNIKFGMTNVRNIGPQEFLGYVKNAKYVITTSFHGVALSIQFEKEFYYALSTEVNNFNSRINNVVNLLDLGFREIVEGKEIDKEIPINYSVVNKKLAAEKEKSLKYLKQVVLD
ncbi:polysaccharide pyruvyl transferase family protein [Guptibacillus hwajinpoensis]|uniref:polysaccharide pyruvyl transferase family protein n=1 Tax=Guptibacillus hwajinpoensis TaxID=208199 RepID=UPI003D06AD5C